MLLAAMLVCLAPSHPLTPSPSHAAQPLVVPVEAEVTPVADEPTPARKRFSRAERKLAREVIRDAAESAGMSRLRFMRAVDRGDQAALDELKVSLAGHEEAAEIDVDRLREILQVILDFISQLLALFSMFASDAPTVDGELIAYMSVAPERCGPLGCRVDQTKPDQTTKPDQVATRGPIRRFRTRVDIRTPRVQVQVGKRVRVRVQHRRAA